MLRHGFCSLLLAGTALGALRPTAVRRQESVAPETTAAPTVDFSSVTGCHLHAATQYCLADGTEYKVIAEATPTNTDNWPSSYTGCHNHETNTYCFAPTGGSEVQIVDPEAQVATTAAHTHDDTANEPTVTAITGCHFEDGSSVFCTADSTEYYVQTTITATTPLPAQYTGCHSHGEEMYCMSDDGEAAVIPADEIESGEADPDERHCHFHAGVEHCVGGSGEEEHSCTTTDRDYDIGIRIGMLFVVLVASSIGVFGPILLSSFVYVKTNLFLTILKQFGTGVIISTALVHLFTHASLMFGNECLGELKYEATTAAIVMAGLFVSFVIEFIVQRALRWQAIKKSDGDVALMSPQAIAAAEMANITIMEAGIIFHSLLIGITLVVAGDAYFITLAIVIIFHQMFEGIALGTRIASLGYGTSAAATLASSDSHMHAHGQPVAAPVDRSGPSTVSLFKKLTLAAGFAIVTPIGMAIGIGVLHQFNGNDPSTIVAIGTLDAFSAGILMWVGLVEMWAHDWLVKGELVDADLLTSALSLFGLVAGMVLMSLLGKWA